MESFSPEAFWLSKYPLFSTEYGKACTSGSFSCKAFSAEKPCTTDSFFPEAFWLSKPFWIWGRLFCGLFCGTVLFPTFWIFEPLRVLNLGTEKMLSSPKPSLQNGAETFRTLRTGSPGMFGKEISRWFWDLDHHGEIASRKKIPTLRTGLTASTRQNFCTEI